MTTHTIIDLSGTRITYTEYIVKAGETTLQQIARDQLHDESRFHEIKKWENGTDNKIPDGTTLHQGWVLLLPPVSEDIFTLKLTALEGSYIRNGHGKNFEAITSAPINTPFPYKKNSLTQDSNGLLWVQVNLAPPYNIDSHKVAHSVGWLCVKEGNAHYTTPLIDIGKPTG
jgi:hypothetical protein